ncbi:ABC transporter substrate-binding protein [Sphingopyxis sp. GC21]|uniref:ABC transporter substrate-binding protein n=1 Tax=Sphingopyxis sp. GC21 TaxID=2933562 RepID=UPI0021E382EA|nr:ABC transporter substrate-binding protein [Sphingopyxis sp. GC21]
MMVKIIWFVPPAISVVAEQRGFFGREGVSVEATATRSSDEQFEALRDGRVEAAVTAMDNVIMWNRRPGGGAFRIVAQVEAKTGISLVARPEFETVAALAGRRLLVDSAVNGFVVALRAMLADAGTDFDRCDVVEAGGVKERFDRLLEGEGDATLLGPPFVELAEQHGLRRIADADAAYPGFPGQGVVVRSPLPETRASELVRWLAAMESARAASVRDPAATAAALQTTGLPPPIAARLAGFVASTLWPSRDGIALLVEQRRRLGLDGGDATYDALVDTALLDQLGAPGRPDPLN